MAIPLDPESEVLHGKQATSASRPLLQTAGSRVHMHHQHNVITCPTSRFPVIRLPHSSVPSAFNSCSSTNDLSFVHQLFLELYSLYLKLSSSSAAVPMSTDENVVTDSEQVIMPDIVTSAIASSPFHKCPVTVTRRLIDLNTTSHLTAVSTSTSTSTIVHKCLSSRSPVKDQLTQQKCWRQSHHQQLNRTSQTCRIGRQLQSVADSYQATWETSRNLTNLDKHSYSHTTFALKLGLIGSILIVITGLKKVC